MRAGCISLTHMSEVISRLLEPFGSEVKQSQPFSEWETDFTASCNMLLCEGIKKPLAMVCERFFKTIIELTRLRETGPYCPAAFLPAEPQRWGIGHSAVCVSQSLSQAESLLLVQPIPTA